MNRSLYVFLLLATACAVGCSNKYHSFASNYPFRSASGVPDYSNEDYWAALPSKWDPSDSVPLPLRNAPASETGADVFFLYPTTYTDRSMPMGWNARIDDADLNAKTDYSTILFQASAFNAAGKIYAPRYRQASYMAYFPKTADDSAQAMKAFELAYQDVKTAFLYYLGHYNQGRPFIISSHSQGTNHALRLIKELIDSRPLQQQLIAAYLIGMPLPLGFFGSMPICSTPEQTGCAVSWRTFREGYVPEYIEREPFVAAVTNPLTWESSAPTADREQNQGGVLLNFNKVIPQLTDASVHGGVLWTHRPHFFGNIFFNLRNYHIADLNLFYLNIRENAVQRVRAYKK